MKTLSSTDNAQARNIAEIIQTIQPDVLLLNEFDYDQQAIAANMFRQNYLSVAQNEARPITYPHIYLAPSNTGVDSGFDLDNDGRMGGLDDAFGFGSFPGRYGMALFSKFPIESGRTRTFQRFLWKDMPGALLPDDRRTADPADWYSQEELEIVRLSSKSHWDVPINVNGEIVHILAAHPTPPVFDGPEDRNGLRNHDEIRLWADYIDPARSSYIEDDSGTIGGLEAGAKFVIVGDYNADPIDGDSTQGAILQLLDHPFVNTSITPGSNGAEGASLRQRGINVRHQGDHSVDTADFSDGSAGNLRVDYALPSINLSIVEAGVFWPAESDPLFRLVGEFDRGLPGPGFPSSDHRLVYVDILVPEPSGFVLLITGVISCRVVRKGRSLGMKRRAA